MRRFASLFLFAMLAGAAEDPGEWRDWRFLIGDWAAGQNGGEGQFSFQPELRSRVLIRKNRALVRGTVHEDLMVLYREPGAEQTRAIYFDNEGHTIRYLAEASEKRGAWTFLSEPAAGQPRFRLTYTRSGPGSVQVRFEIAPAGKPESFSVYLEGDARRR